MNRWAPDDDTIHDRIRYALRALGDRDAYELLAASDTDGQAQLQRAYRQRMRALHPDVGGDEAEARLVNIAWHLLRTDREAYDRYLAAKTEDHNPLDDGPLEPAEDPWTDAEPWTEAEHNDADLAGGSGEPTTHKGKHGDDDSLTDETDDEETRRQWRAFERDLRRSRLAERRPQPAETPAVSLPLAILLIVMTMVVIAIIGTTKGTTSPADMPNRYGTTSATLPSPYTLGTDRPFPTFTFPTCNMSTHQTNTMCIPCYPYTFGTSTECLPFSLPSYPDPLASLPLSLNPDEFVPSTTGR